MTKNHKTTTRHINVLYQPFLIEQIWNDDNFHKIVPLEKLKVYSATYCVVDGMAQSGLQHFPVTISCPFSLLSYKCQKTKQINNNISTSISNISIIAQQQQEIARDPFYKQHIPITNTIVKRICQCFPPVNRFFTSYMSAFKSAYLYVLNYQDSDVSTRLTALQYTQAKPHIHVPTSWSHKLCHALHCQRWNGSSNSLSSHIERKIDCITVTHNCSFPSNASKILPLQTETFYCSFIGQETCVLSY